MDNRPIGMFDSGVGGMTVFSEIIKLLPNENIIYYGDTKRFPYGNKSKENIIELSKKAVQFLISKNVKCIVIACGTATSQALDELRKTFDIPIIGIIEPTICYINENKKLKSIGIIATQGTIKSKAWEKNIYKIKPNMPLQSKACPLLAELAEAGWTNNNIAKLVLEEYLKDFSNIDALILGCTHYPLFSNTITNILGKDVELINTGEKTAMFLKKQLLKQKLENCNNLKPSYQIYLSDTENNFKDIANKLLNGAFHIDTILKV